MSMNVQLTAKAESTASAVKSALAIDLSAQGAEAGASFARGLQSQTGPVSAAAAALKAAAAGAAGGGGKQGGNLRRGVLLSDVG